MSERDVIIYLKGGEREQKNSLFFASRSLYPRGLFLIHNIFCHRSSRWDIIA